MRAAGPRPKRQARLLVAEAPGALREQPLESLGDFLDAGDVVVFNDAATLPASLELEHKDRALELRLIEAPEGARLRGVVFGAPGWRQDTDQRPVPPTLSPGDRLKFGDVFATVVESEGRLVTVAVESGDALGLVYEHGHPIQYSYHYERLSIQQLQTPWAGPPVAVEMPSAGRSLTQALMQSLLQKGVGVHSLTHAAGISATGDPALDALLPLPERFEIPSGTKAAVVAAHRAGRRVIAVGTSVLRALESADLESVGDSRGTTRLHIGPSFEPRWVHGILSGMHQEGTSHDRLMQSFLPVKTLRAATRYAAALGFVEHEFGDLMLVVDRRPFRQDVHGVSMSSRDRARSDGPLLVA